MLDFASALKRTRQCDLVRGFEVAAGGQTLTFSYSNGNLISVSDALTHTFQFGYTNNALTSITDPLNHTTQLGYTNGRLTTLTDPRNNETTISYDGSNRVQSITIGGTHYYDAFGRRMQRDVNPLISNLYTGPGGCQGLLLYPRGAACGISVGYCGSDENQYKHSGNQLVTDTWLSCTQCLSYSVVYTNTLDYDGNGNLSHLTRDIYNGNPTVQATNALTFTWEAATNHLTTVTKDLGGSLTTYTFQYDSLSRITQFCSAPATCSNFYYVGDTDWLSHVTDYYGTLISHYYYANGRPFAVDLRNVWGGYERDYYRYNWHGDVSAVMDSNGNGDGWNNVSPFGDNGNGAYPANPNLEQYYGYGGAWGYLYFNGVFGGTNTVRSVDLYYIHGRWWHPDMGIFLSPNEKGDYLYGGDGQDPVNDGWLTGNAPLRQDGTFRYIHSANYGWIDLNHFGGWRRAAEFITHLKNAEAEFSETEFEQQLIGSKFVLAAAGVSVRYQVPIPIPENLQEGVAMAMFLKLESHMETFQLFNLADLGGSGFAMEDLPTDYLGFYVGIQNYRCDTNSLNCDPDFANIRGRVPDKVFSKLVKILDGANAQLDAEGTNQEPPHCNLWLNEPNIEQCLEMKNLSFMPLVNRDGQGLRNVPWPPELTIPPIFDGWSEKGCTGFISVTGRPPQSMPCLD